jgi:hypothetical protein
MKEAERRQTLGSNRRILRCGARPFGARTLDGVPPRFSPKGIIPSQRLSFRPGFLGRGLHGRYPPSPVPVQGSTSHPGPNAGRHDAQAAREQAANPPAGTALAPMTRCASALCPSRSEDDAVTAAETYVNKKVTRATAVVSLSPEGRGWGEGVRKLRNQIPSSEPPQPVLLPSGEKGRSAHIATPPQRAKSAIRGRAYSPHSHQVLTRSLAIFG